MHASGCLALSCAPYTLYLHMPARAACPSLALHIIYTLYFVLAPQARVVAAEQDHAHALSGVEAVRRMAAASSERRLAALKLLEVARISGERRLALQRWRLVTAVLAMSTSEASALGEQWADPEPNPKP